MVKFIFEGIDFPSLNVALDLAKRAKRSRGRYKKKYTGSLYDVEKSKLNTLIGTIARQQHKGLLTGKYTVCFVWYLESFRKDPDNIDHAVKYILDGMVKGGVLAEDGHKNVGGGKVHCYFRDKERPRVEVYFIEQDKNEFLRALIKKELEL